MPSQQKVRKGLPRRCSNTHLKEARARRWKAGQERKEFRREAQAEAEKRNKKLKAEGKLTPWETAKAKARGEL